MRKRKTTHVVPNPDGGWDVKHGGSNRIYQHEKRKEDAVDWGRDHSRGRGSELYVHGKNGKFQKKDSHGGDDFPPKG